MESRVEQLARKQHRALAIAMVLSIGVHAAAFALLGLHISVFGDPDEARFSRADTPASNRYLRQQPLQVIDLAIAQTSRAASSAATDGSEQTASAEVALVLPRRIATPNRAGPQLQPVEELPVNVAGYLTVASSPAARTAVEEVAFQPASRAAKRAARDKKRADGRRKGRGISIVVNVGGNGGDCAAPTPTAIIDNIAGALVGRGRTRGGAH